MGTRRRLSLITLTVIIVGLVGWFVGWTTRDAVVGAGGDWAAAIRNVAAWAGDASKVALGALIGGAAGLAAGWSNRRAERAERIRSRRIEQIRHTEVVVSETFRGLREMISSRSGLMLAWRTRSLQATIDNAFQADLSLIGEIEAAVAVYTSFGQLFTKAPIVPWWLGPFGRLWRGLLLTVSNPWNSDDLAALNAAREECLAALRRQEDRALRDEPLARLDADELTKRVDVAGFEAIVARAAGYSRGQGDDEVTRPGE